MAVKQNLGVGWKQGKYNKSETRSHKPFFWLAARTWTGAA